MAKKKKKRKEKRFTYSWEAMLRSSFSFTLFQVVCPVKVWTLVSCAWYNKHQQEKEIRQFREKARQHKQSHHCYHELSDFKLSKSDKWQNKPGGGLSGNPFLRLHWAGKIPGLSLWHRKDRPALSDSSISQRLSIVTRKYCSLYTWNIQHRTQRLSDVLSCSHTELVEFLAI